MGNISLAILADEHNFKWALSLHLPWIAFSAGALHFMRLPAFGVQGSCLAFIIKAVIGEILIQLYLS